MSTKCAFGPWEIYSRMSKSSSNTVFLVCRTVTRENGRQETEFLTNHGPATQPLRRRASRFRSEAAARNAITKATKETPDEHR